MHLGPFPLGRIVNDYIALFEQFRAEPARTGKACQGAGNRLLSRGRDAATGCKVSRAGGPEGGAGREAGDPGGGAQTERRKMTSRIWILLLALACVSPVAAQTYPTRPVTIIVPYPPGGLIDIVARILQPRLQAELGQTVFIENRSGAGGNVGAEAVARSSPDGYTLLLANPSLGISPHLYDKLNYKPIEDFAYIGLYGTVPNVLVVKPQVPVKNVQEFVAYARKNPGKLNYASPGYGTSPQMSMELFKAMTNTFIVHIPFRGSGPSQAAMLAGEVQCMFDNLPPQLPHIKSGKVHALAVTSLKRSPVMPELPTLDESGLKGYEVTAWFGLVAPAAAPREVVMRINQAMNRATSDAQTRDALVSRGATIVQHTPEDALAFIKAETAKWGPVVKRAGAKVE